MTETIGSRNRASNEMRLTAARLRKEADNWEALAARLDHIENYALSQCKDSAEGPVPYVGAGSQTEAFLYELACRRR